MNKKLIELRRKLTEKLKEARELIDAGKVEEGQKATQEAQEIKDQIVLEEQMQELEDTIADDNEVVLVAGAYAEEGVSGKYERSDVEGSTVCVGYPVFINLNKSVESFKGVFNRNLRDDKTFSGAV